MKISLGVRFKSSNSAKGATAEKSVARFLRANGFTAKVLTYGGTDIIATNKTTGEKIRLEVKFSSVNKDGKYRATTIKQGATDHRKSDYIVFVCQPKYTGGECTVFVIPSSVQGEKTFLCVTSNPETYSGYLAAYRNRWDYIGL